MGVSVRNTWGETFADELLSRHLGHGRATGFASFGILCRTPEAWPRWRRHRQTLVGRAIRLPQLAVGEQTTVYFQVDASGARTGKPPVEFALLNLTGTPDPTNSMRHNSRAIYIAEVSYDPVTGQVGARAPEGTLTLTMRSMAVVDTRSLTQLCRRLTQPSGTPAGRLAPVPELDRLLAEMKAGHCDQRTLCALIRLVCRCLGEGGGGGGPGGPGGNGWPRVCLPGVIWLPLGFDYAVETPGGFTGQYGPLPFPGSLVENPAADHRGHRRTGRHHHPDRRGQDRLGEPGRSPTKIGTVGASNRITTDACIIELDGGRPAIQDVADAITGEPNNQPIIGLDTVIPIDPQVALPSLASV